MTAYPTTDKVAMRDHCWTASKARGTTRLVELCLVEHYNLERGYAWPSQSRIAKQCGLNIETVRDSLKRLVDVGQWTSVTVPTRMGEETRYAPTGQMASAPFPASQRGRAATARDRGRFTKPTPPVPTDEQGSPELPASPPLPKLPATPYRNIRQPPTRTSGNPLPEHPALTGREQEKEQETGTGPRARSRRADRATAGDGRSSHLSGTSTTATPAEPDVVRNGATSQGSNDSDVDDRATAVLATVQAELAVLLRQRPVRSSLTNRRGHAKFVEWSRKTIAAAFTAGLADDDTVAAVLAGARSVMDEAEVGWGCLLQRSTPHIAAAAEKSLAHRRSRDRAARPSKRVGRRGPHGTALPAAS